jgi:hypothetical protein
MSAERQGRAVVQRKGLFIVQLVLWAGGTLILWFTFFALLV